MLYQHTEEIRITDGPSRLELFVAGAYAFDEHNFHNVRFKTDAGDFVARITSLQSDDGLDYRLTGSIIEVKYYHDPKSLLCTRDDFSARYSPKRRTGIITHTVFTADDKPDPASQR